MIPVSPVIPKTDLREVIIAEHQDEYQNLPVIPLSDGRIVSRWKLTDEEKRIAFETGDIYVYLLPCGAPITPHLLSVEKPVLDAENYTDEILEADLIEPQNETPGGKIKVKIRCEFDAEQFKSGMEDGFSEGEPYIETYKGRVFAREDTWIVTNPAGEKDVYSSEEFHAIYAVE